MEGYEHLPPRVDLYSLPNDFTTKVKECQWEGLPTPLIFLLYFDMIKRRTLMVLVDKGIVRRGERV